jgi:hypothetical protein
MQGYTAYLLPEAERERLLKSIKPAYENVIAHHVTYEFGVADSHPLPPAVFRASVYGVANDGEGLQTLVVDINGDGKRPDGKLFHITWSLSEGRKAVESNKLLEQWPLLPDKSRPKTIFYYPIPITLEPAFIPHGSTND